MERIIEDVRALAFRDERLDGCDGRRPGYIDDLEWRWQCADDDMEPPSNMSAMVAAIQRGGPAHTNHVTNDIDDRAIQAAEKAHAIDEALGRISEAQQEVLWALYGTPDGSAEAILKHLPKAAELHAECVKRKATHASLVSWFIGVSNTDRIWGSAVAGQIYEKVLSEAVAQAKDAAKAYKAARSTPRLFGAAQAVAATKAKIAAVASKAKPKAARQGAK